MKNQTYIWKPGENEFQLYDECQLTNGDLLQLIALKADKTPQYMAYINYADGRMAILQDKNYNDVQNSQNKERKNKGSDILCKSKALTCSDPRARLAGSPGSGEKEGGKHYDSKGMVG